MRVTRASVVAIGIACAFLWSMTALGADDYPKGHGALEVFDDPGFAATPLWVRIWLGFLISTFAVGLVFAWKHPIARWAIGGFVVSAATTWTWSRLSKAQTLR